MPNLGIPSRNVVDECLAEMEREEQREREALSAFYRREKLRKRPVHVTGNQVFIAMTIALTLGLIAAWKLWVVLFGG